MTTDTTTEPFTMRQSTLATWSRCQLSARFEIESGERHAPPLARGSLFHLVAERMMRTMKKTGNEYMPQAEALEILYEVESGMGMDSADVLVLPPDERQVLRQCVVKFATEWTHWRAERIMALEDQLSAEIVCQDGVTRVLTGTPDLLIANPRDGAIEIIDYKTSPRPPSKPRDPDDPKEPRRYLTGRGRYQLDAYGLLALREFPGADKAVLRELHVFLGEESPPAELRRDELEHVERLIGVDLMLMDRALSEGPESDLWKAVGGTTQCSWCVGKDRCPRPAAERGGITGLPMAEEYAQDIGAISARREQMLEMAKDWVEANGPIPLPDGKLLGWDMPPPQDAAKAPDAERGTCRWCGDPIYKSEAAKSHMLDKRRNYHGGPDRGEPDCKAAWDAAGGARSFRVYHPDEYGVASDFEPAPA